MMPRHGDLDQVVMNEYSALLLLSSISLNSRTYLGHMILCFLCRCRFPLENFQSPIQEACTQPVEALMTTILRRRRPGGSCKTCRYQYQ